MFNNAIYCEFLKLKHSKLFLLIIMTSIVCAVPNLIVCNNQYSEIIWSWIFQNNIFNSTLIFAPLLYCLITGIIFSREYSDRTINTLFTTPVNRIYFYFSKLIVLLCLVSLFYLINFFFILIVGLFLKHESVAASYLIQIFKIYCLCIITCFSLIPAPAFFSIASKNLIPSVVLGIGTLMANMSILGCLKNYIDIFPSTAPIGVITKALHKSKFESLNYSYCITSLLLTFIVFTLLSILYYKKSDIHSGS